MNVRDRSLRVVERAHPKADPAEQGQVASADRSGGFQCGGANESISGAGCKIADARGYEDAVQYLRANRRENLQAAGQRWAACGSERSAGGHRAVTPGHSQTRAVSLALCAILAIWLFMCRPATTMSPSRAFRVLYMQDGQNPFDRATSFGGQDWNVRGAADHLIGIGAVQPLVIVGIYNARKSRIHEYTPVKSPKLGGGRADRYAKFLIEEVMPFVQREYRVNSDPRVTGLGGSSLGGLLALYLGLKHRRFSAKLPHSRLRCGGTSA